MNKPKKGEVYLATAFKRENGEVFACEFTIRYDEQTIVRQTEWQPVGSAVTLEAYHLKQHMLSFKLREDCARLFVSPTYDRAPVLIPLEYFKVGQLISLPWLSNYAYSK